MLQRPGASGPEKNQGTRDEAIKVTLVLSGAVALGSFEAGVVHELMEAIATGAPITIDIIAGSSAGSLVGAMTAKSLVMGVPYQSMLSQWREVTLDHLTRNYETSELAQRREKPLDTGILSTEAAREVIYGHLVVDPVSRTFQPAYPAGKIVLLMTMTNLDGLPGSGEDGDDVRFSEAVTFTFRVPDPYDLRKSAYPPAIWERVALIGLAGSAFPGAFDPQYVPWIDRLHIPRLLKEEWENEQLLSLLHQMDPQIQPHMRYVDGGILEEQPVERAIGSLVRVTGGAGQAGPETLVYDPRRVFLLIEPDPPVTTLEAVRAGVQSTWFSTFNRATRLWSLSSTPHTSQWRVLSANARQVKLLDFLADLARRMQSDKTSAAQGASETAEAFAAVNRPAQESATPGGLIPPEIYADAIRSFYLWLEDEQRFRADMDWLDQRSSKRFGDLHREAREALLRLRASFLALYGLDPAEPRHHQEVLADLHLTLAESLGLTQPWALLHTISPDDPRVMLRGEQAIHFGGFFAREFLEHDYEVGRYFARKWLRDAVPAWAPADPIKSPVSSDEGITWAILWRNRGPLWRIAGRFTQALLEGAGLRVGGAGQLLVKVAGWSFVLAAIHALLVTGALLAGWIELPDGLAGSKLWIIIGSSIFPLVLGVLIGLMIRGGSFRTVMRRFPSVESKRILNLFLGRDRR